MAFVRLWEKEREGPSIDDKGRRTCRRTFGVLMNSPTDGGLTVISSPGLPSLHGMYVVGGEMDLGLLVKSLEPRQDTGNPLVWEVTVSYDSDTVTPEEGDPNPLARPPELAWSVEKVKVVVERDINGEAITNSAYEAFDPPIEKDKIILVLTITRNRAMFDAVDAAQQIGKTNSLTWLGFTERKARLDDRSASLATENGLTFWKERIVVKIDEQTWNIFPLDAGFHERDGSGDIVPSRDSGGALRQTAVLLDSFGFRIDLDEDDPVFLDYEIYEQMDFQTNLEFP